MEDRNQVKDFYKKIEDLKIGESITECLTKYDAFFIIEWNIINGIDFNLKYSRYDKFSKLAVYQITAIKIQ